MEIVKVQFLNEAGQPAGREYSYFTAEPLGMGEIVQVPVSKGKDFPEEHLVKAAVVAVNVPEAAIAAFRDRVKVIPGKPPTAEFKPTVVIEPEVPDVVLEHINDAAGLAAEEGAKDAIQGRLVADEKASADAGTLVADLVHNPGPYGAEPFPDNGGALEPPPVESDAGLPAPLVILNTEVEPMTVAMNPDLVTVCREAKRLLEIAQGRTITRNEDLKPATDDLAIIRKGIRLVQEIRKRILAPFRAKVDVINAAFADIIRPLEEADRLTAGKVTAFDQEQRRKAAEAKRIEDEKFKLAQEEAALKGGEITVPLGTAEAPPPVPEHTRTELGTLGGRANWKARVVDFKLLPDEYKLPNEPLLNSFARSTKGTRPIPGVEFYDDRVVTVRTK